MDHERVRFALASAAVGTALATAGSARAESIACTKTETQPACLARLRCKPDETLEQCQDRLVKCTASTNSLETCKGGEPRSNDRGTTDGEHDRGRDHVDRSGDDGDRGESVERRSGGRTRRRPHSGRGFEANKTFGLGLELGEPSGLTGKVFVTKSGAIDFGVGYIYDYYYYGDGLNVYADYLWHPATIASTPSFELPFYIGAGLRFWDFHYCVANMCDYSGSSLGIRVPIGIAFDFNNTPLDVFIQLVPVLDFVGGDYYDRFHDREHFGIDVSVGARFWFK